MKTNKKAQVWIETVIYTLIFLILIGAVLAIVRPKLQELQDKTVIEGTLGVMEDINSKILSTVNGGQGNVRVSEFSLKKGTLEIHDDLVIFTLDDSRLTYSEPDTPVKVGNINVLTTKKGKVNTITLTLSYTGKYNLEYEGSNLGKSSTPYKLSIKNNGPSTGGNPRISLTLV